MQYAYVVSGMLSASAYGQFWKIEVQTSEENLMFGFSTSGVGHFHMARHRHTCTVRNTKPCTEAVNAHAACSTCTSWVGCFLQVADASSIKIEIQFSDK